MKKLTFLKIFLFLILSSCSYFQRSGVQGQKLSGPQSVPKEQYTELLEKYEMAINKLRQYEGDKNEMVSETINVFDDREKSDFVLKNSLPGTSENPSKDDLLEKEIGEFHEILQLIRDGKTSLAMKRLQVMEHSAFPQIRVRVKYHIGELLFNQGEYDLALQVFEDLVKNYSFSGVVIKSLKRLVISCEKLKLSQKKLQYESLLKDVFEQTE